MHKKLCKNSATLFFFLCYHTSKAVFSVNVHLCISLRETLKIADLNTTRCLKILPFATLIEPYGYDRNSQKIRKFHFCHSKYLQNKVKIL